MKTGFLSIRGALPAFLACSLIFSGCDGSFLRGKIEEFSGKKQAAPVPPADVPPTPPVPAPPTPPAPPPVPVPPLTETQPSVPGVPPPPTAPAADDASMINEINAYVKCLNRTASRTADSRRRYLSWVNEQSGPTCKETYISYGLYTLYEDGVKTCNDAADSGKTTGPSLPKAEQAAGELAAAYAELVPLAQKAEDYYQQQDYKDDGCAKAKEMHPKLMSAFNRFLDAERRLSAEVDAIKADVELKELARLEQQQGKRLPYYTQSFMIASRRLMRTVPKENIAEFQSAAYLAAYDGLQKEYDAMLAYAEANAPETSKTFWYSGFESSAKNFFTQAKFLKRNLAEGKKADARGMNEVVDSYNRLVGDANNLRFDFP